MGGNGVRLTFGPSRSSRDAGVFVILFSSRVSVFVSLTIFFDESLPASLTFCGPKPGIC